ncbi:MAG: hypothetical protein AAGG44_11290, partial [Planctomycetota bacterium]
MSWKWSGSLLGALLCVSSWFLPVTTVAQVGDGSLGGLGEDKAIQIIQVTPKGVETPNGFDALVKFDYEIGSLEPLRIRSRGGLGMGGAYGDGMYGGGGRGYAGDMYGGAPGMGAGGGMGAGMGMGMGMGGMSAGMGMGGMGMGDEDEGLGLGSGGSYEAQPSPTLTLNVLVRRDAETSRIEEVTVMIEPIQLYDRGKAGDPRDNKAVLNDRELWLFKSDIATAGGMYGGYGDYGSEGGLDGIGEMDGGGGDVAARPKKLMDLHYLVDKRIAYEGEKFVLTEEEHAIVMGFIDGELRREDILRLLKENAQDVAKVDELEADLKKVIRKQYQTGLSKQKYEIAQVESELEILRKEVARREAALERVVEAHDEVWASVPEILALMILPVNKYRITDG